MGLSSSQARLLNLTARMHQIEYKAARLESMKLQMANESTRVYEDYLEALDKTKIQYKVLNTDGSITYSDIKQFSDFTNAGYAIDFNGVIYDNKTPVSYKDNAGNAIAVNKMTDAAAQTALGADYVAGTTYYRVGGSNYVTEAQLKTVTPAGKEINTVPTGTVTISSVVRGYAELCRDAFGADINNPPANVSEVITNLINSGDVTLVSMREDGTFAKESDVDFAHYETSVSTNTGLQEVTDEVALKKAEAKYEADMKKIDLKDRKYDTDLAALDTERNAIKQEMETLKTVAKENVERTFKLFS